MSKRNARPYGRNPMIWRKASAADISAAERRLANEHAHAYFQHRTLVTHMACNCGWICRRDVVPADLVFAGPVKAAGRG